MTIQEAKEILENLEEEVERHSVMGVDFDCVELYFVKKLIQATQVVQKAEDAELLKSFVIIARPNHTPEMMKMAKFTNDVLAHIYLQITRGINPLI